MIKKLNRYIWEEKDIKYLKDNFLNKTNKELCKKLGVSKSTIERKKNELNLPNKNDAESIIKYKNNIKNVPGFLYVLHHKENKSVQKMSKIIGVSRISINRLMDKYNIKYRNQSEALNIRYKTMTKEEKKELTKAAHQKMKELAKKGEHPFQKIWKEKPEEMRKILKENIPKIIENRTNGMKGVTGFDHPNWNPDLTPEEREKKRRELNKINWREKVFKKDNYNCQICNDDTGGNLVAHHKYSYMAYPDKRTDIDNGVTLCESCHKEFHMKYGWGENTAEQFKEFKAVVCNG